VSWIEQAERMAATAQNSIITTVVATIAGAIVWVVRRVLTNQRQIELLEREIKHRDDLRKADRGDMKELRDDVKEIRKFIMEGSK
jgi:cell division protein FtsL